MNKKSLKGPIYLLLCAFFWGMAFSSQSNAMNHIQPYTFVFLRSTITCAVLSAALPLLNRLNGSSDRPVASNARHFAVGGLCGLILVTASILQQIGLVTTTTAKSGFITALYIVIVPILGIFFGRRPRPTLWLGVLVSLTGLYFLCMKDSGLNVNVGDLFTLASAFVFALHIMTVDRFGGALNSVKLSTIQFGAAAVAAGLLTLFLETPTWEGILACWQDIAFAAVFSGALGYTFQIVGQKYTDPTLASLLVCLESVFAAFGGWVVLGETLSGRELFGCALMLSASVIALLPGRNRESAR